MIWYSHLFQNLPQFIVIHTVFSATTSLISESQLEMRFVSVLIVILGEKYCVKPGLSYSYLYFNLKNCGVGEDS